MHKDQADLQNRVLPQILDRILAENNPVAERDCTVLVRLLGSGPDPLFLMESCPEDFLTLCSLLCLTERQGRWAIEEAHWKGPGALLTFSYPESETTFDLDEIPTTDLDVPSDKPTNGIPFNFDFWGEDFHVQKLPLSWRQELLWLVLASLSDCTEEGYNGTSMVQRIRIQAASIRKLALLVEHGEAGEIWDTAVTLLHSWGQDTEFQYREGLLTTDHDHGFYVGFKSGHKVVGVKAGNNLFIGTIPSTSLEAEGVRVDKQISPQFGIRF